MGKVTAAHAKQRPPTSDSRYVRGSIVAATLHLRKRAGDRGVHPQRLTDCLMHMNFTRVGSARADVRPGPWVPRLTHTYIGSKGPDRISPDRGVGEGLPRSCSFSLRDKEWCKKKKKKRLSQSCEQGCIDAIPCD